MNAEQRNYVQSIVDTLVFVDEFTTVAKCKCHNCDTIAVKHYVVNCKHIFCTPCLRKLLHHMCPICGDVEITEVKRDEKFEKQVHNLNVECPYKDRGCLQTIPLLNYQDHETNCSFSTKSLLPKVYQGNDSNENTNEDHETNCSFSTKSLLPKVYRGNDSNESTNEVVKDVEMEKQVQDLKDGCPYTDRECIQEIPLSDFQDHETSSRSPKLLLPILYREKGSKERINEMKEGGFQSKRTTKKLERKSKRRNVILSPLPHTEHETNKSMDTDSDESVSDDEYEDANDEVVLPKEDPKDPCTERGSVDVTKQENDSQNDLQPPPLPPKGNISKQDPKDPCTEGDSVDVTKHKSDSQNALQPPPLPRKGAISKTRFTWSPNTTHDIELTSSFTKERRSLNPEANKTEEANKSEAGDKINTNQECISQQPSRTSNKQEENREGQHIFDSVELDRHCAIDIWKIDDFERKWGKAKYKKRYNFMRQKFYHAERGFGYEVELRLTKTHVVIDMSWSKTDPSYIHARKFTLIDQSNNSPKRHISLTDMPYFSNKPVTVIKQSCYYENNLVPRPLFQIEYGTYVRCDSILIKVSLIPMSLIYKSITCHEGNLLWPIDNYSVKKQEAIKGVKPYVISESFYTEPGGYMVHAWLYPNGSDASCGKYISIYVTFIAGEFDEYLPKKFNGMAKFHLKDQSESPDKQDVYREVVFPYDENCPFQGRHDFILQSEAENAKYLKNDALLLKIEVQIA